MRSTKLWLILAAVGFASWLGYLAYLAWDLKQEAGEGGGQPIVLSRPQFLIADLIVTADIESKDKDSRDAVIKEVHWSRRDDADRWLGQTIVVEDLGRSRGLDAAGSYIVPLILEQGVFRVAPSPPSPGFTPPPEGGLTRIYPHNHYTARQLQQILARRGKS